ncbi:ribosome biogenesis GTPase Der, partial [Thermoproteota archaeon]
MKHIPRIIIVGRPNVGKSTLINRILKRKKAITHDTSGVTRDLAEFLTKWQKHDFFIVDTGGIFLSDSKDIYLQNKIEEKVLKAIEKAEKVIFLTDVTAGIHPMDKHIADFLQPFKEKVALAVNKADNEAREIDSAQFFELGLGQPYPISSLLGLGVPELMDIVLSDISESADITESLDLSYKISIVGRPNVGKSSLINGLINEEKMIVDDKAGTTRDAVEVFFEYQDNRYVFTDTAGMRRKARISDSIEFYSVVRSAKSIKQADLVIVVLDASSFMCDQDKKIINSVYCRRGYYRYG